MSQPLRLPPQHAREAVDFSNILENHYVSEDQAESSIQNSDTGLCQRCRLAQPKLKELLSLDPESIPRRERTVLEFHSADDLFLNSECSLCQALNFICPRTWFNDTRCHARLVVEPIENHLEGYGRRHLTRHSCLTLAYPNLMPSGVDKERIDIFDSRALPWIQDAAGYIAEKSAHEQEAGTTFASSLPSHVDFRILRKWLEFSQRREETDEATNSVRNLIVIDCQSREIIKAPPAKYVALSYIWGQQKPREKDVEEKEGRLYLTGPLGKTIEDAIIVTQRLNLRYLWIDRYCIPKDDLEHQISRMHEIYGGAYVTIIAAAGNGPEHGIPGVNNRTRIKPPPVTIGSRTLHATFPSPKLLVEGSKWYSRGWTFQEGLLSCRRLVFTDHQVYFHCDNFVFIEAFNTSLPGGIDLKNSFSPPLGTLFSFASARQSREGAPWDKIMRYCTLDLKYPEDTVNAILGVLHYYQEGKYRPSTRKDEIDHPKTASIRHITGLPISKDTGQFSTNDKTWEDSIIHAFFWKSKAPGDRRRPERTPFPSWSWAGWRCECYIGGLVKWSSWNDYAPKLLRSLTTYLPSISIYMDEPNKVLEATEYETMFDEMRDFSKVYYLRVTAPTVEARVVTYNGITDDWRKFDNTGKKFALECSGTENPVPLNLTSNSIYHQPMSPSGYSCLAIILDYDPKYADAREFYFDSDACLLVVGKNKEDYYERIGVAKISREALGKAHVEERKNIKFG